MKKTKTQKGITLIALIITIVVLLILAVVAINSIQDGGIISHAKNAQTKYQGAQENEKLVLSDYASFLDPWEQVKTTVTRKGVTLKVGDTVTDTTANNLPALATGNSWKVLGVENGALLLMTANNLLNDIKLTGNNEIIDGVQRGIWDDTQKKWVSEEKALNDYCKISVIIEGTKATEIRSVNIDDINRVTGHTLTGATYDYYTYPGSAETEAANTLLFGTSSTGYYYWLASSCVDGTKHEMRRVYNKSIDAYDLSSSRYGDYKGVRAVIAITADALLTSNGTNSWTIS